MDQKMKANNYSIFQLLRIGFFAGIGASVPITIISYVPIFFLEDFIMEEIEEYADDYVIYDPADSALEAKIESNSKTKNGWVFLGTLTNSGEHDWTDVTVQVELFDADGNFIDETDGHIQGAITPGTTHNFRVDFYAGEEEEVIFSDYRIAVTAAY